MSDNRRKKDKKNIYFLRQDGPIMYICKLVNGTKEKVFPPNTFLEITYVVSETEEGTKVNTGIDIELVTLAGSPARVVDKTKISLPGDGQSFYIMNSRGGNVQSYHWPPRDNVNANVNAVTVSESEAV